MDRQSAPLRILVVTNLYPSPANPAFGTFVAARVDTLRALGQEVTVVAITDARVHTHVAGKYARLALDAVVAVARSLVTRRRFHVVEAHIAFPTGLLAWLPARLGGARLVLFAHGSDVLRLPWGSGMRRRLARWLFARADLIVANSAFLAGEAERRLGPFARPVEVVSPGIDVPPRWGGEARDGVVFVGRLVDGKGVESLVPAIAALRDRGLTTHLTIIGDGALGPKLRDAISGAGLGDMISAIGAVPPSTVQQRLERAAIVVVPSTHAEGLGLTALEAMANGALVVATRAGGLADTVQDGQNGIVIERGDGDALAEGIERALGLVGTPAGERMREAGLATAMQHERAAVTARSLAIYRQLVGAA